MSLMSIDPKLSANFVRMRDPERGQKTLQFPIAAA